MTTKGTKRVKNFFWKVTKAKAIAALGQFIMLAVHRGMHHNDVLLEVITEYNERYLRDNGLSGVKLVSERELLRLLKGTALEVSHGALMNYKRAGALDCKEPDKPAFYENSTKVVYDLEVAKVCIRRHLAALAGG
jgi:hypothetical protein